MFGEVFIPDSGFDPFNEDALHLIEVNKMFSTSPDLTGRTNIPRVRGFDLPYDFHILKPADRFLNFNIPDLNTICHKRAREILAKDKNIKFFWSGGIDSTLALTYLLENLEPGNKLEVLHTCESLEENPLYPEHIKKFNVPLVSWSDAWETPFNADDYIITATTSDPLTASVDESFYFAHKDWLYKPWTDYFMHRGMSIEHISRFESKMILAFDDLLLPKTTLGARWWFYNYIKFQYWQVRDWNYNLENGVGNNVESFFTSDELEAWAMRNYDSLFEVNEWASYKQPFKNLIYKYWPNKDFRKYKTKQNSRYALMWSWKKMNKFRQMYLFLYADKDQNFRSYTPTYFPFIHTELIKQEIAVL